MSKKSTPLIAYLTLLIAINVFTSEKDQISKNLSVDSTQETTVKVYPFAQQKDDPDISWVSITAERKIIELLYNSGVTVFSPLTRFQAYTEPLYHIKGNVEKKDGVIITTVTLLNTKGDTVSTGDIKGIIGLFRKIRNVIGETVVYALDVSEQNLNAKRTKKKPTSANSAYALYLKAKMKLRAEQPDRAITYFKEAIIEDPEFAMACWTVSQIYKEKGAQDSASLWDKKAREIDKTHPRWPFKDQFNKEQPLKDVLYVSAKQDFKIVDKGMYCKHIVLEKHDLSAIIWVIDPHAFSMDMEMQKKHTGSYSADFLTDSNTILAVNGGFFEMDSKHRVYPSGLISRNGKKLSPVT
jgi:tetratricopeptide (TPR) repeat protein